MIKPMTTHQKFALVCLGSTIATAASAYIISHYVSHGYLLIIFCALTLISGTVAVTSFIALLTKRPKRTIEILLNWLLI